jgi:hypothetical protein
MDHKEGDMEVSNGKDIIIAVCDTPTMGRKYPFLYVDRRTQDPHALCEESSGSPNHPRTMVQ